MNVTVIVCFSLALVLVGAALAREVRLRRALEALLRRLLTVWRRHDNQTPLDH